MKLPPLTNGIILRRYKRFLADIELDNGALITAHCPNTGSMQGCWEPGAAVQLSESDNPKRKYRWTLERVDMGAGWIGVNTTRVNAIVKSFVNSNDIDRLKGYETIRSEPQYLAENFPRSRFDLLLSQKGRRDCYVEIKNTTLYRNQQIQFPDAKTDRGRKHLLLLQNAVKKGHRGVIVFAINRPEGKLFHVAKDIDPSYHQTLVESAEVGVELLAIRLNHLADSVVVGGEVPVSLG